MFGLLPLPSSCGVVALYFTRNGHRRCRVVIAVFLFKSALVLLWIAKFVSHAGTKNFKYIVSPIGPWCTASRGYRMPTRGHRAMAILQPD